MAKKKKQKSTTQSEVIKLLGEIEAVIGDRECIFRGEPTKFEGVTSRLYRKLGQYVLTEQVAKELSPRLAKHFGRDNRGLPTLDNIASLVQNNSSNLNTQHPVSEWARKSSALLLQELQENDADKARERAGSTKNSIEILAEIQHYGGDTNLIDFSESHLVALFFACSNEEHSEEDGQLIILDKRDIEDASSNGQISRDSTFIIHPLPDNRRAFIQRSVMLHEPNGYLEYGDKRLNVIRIPAARKPEILGYLRKSCDILDRTLFPDIQGYVESQRFVWRPMYHLEKIYMLWVGGKHADALEVANGAISSDGKDARLYAARATIYHSMNRYNEALTDYNSAIELDKKNAKLYTSRAAAYRSMNRNDEALLDHNRALKLDEKNPLGYAARAEVYVQMNRNDEALSDFGRAIELDGKQPFFYLVRAITYGRSGKVDKAMDDMATALKLAEERGDDKLVGEIRQFLNEHSEAK